MTEVLQLLGDIAKHDPAIVAVVLVVCAFLVFMYLQGRDQKEDRRATREVMLELNATLKENASERGASRVQNERMVQALEELRNDHVDLSSIAKASTDALNRCSDALRASTEAVRESTHTVSACQKELREARTHG